MNSLNLITITSYEAMTVKLFVFHVFVVSTMSTLKGSVAEKKGTCIKLREQLEALEKETAAKLTEMDQYNKDMQVGLECKHCVLRDA